MTVKYEDEIYEFLKGESLLTIDVSKKYGVSYRQAWTALLQLEQKKLAIQKIDGQWMRVDELE